MIDTSMPILYWPLMLLAAYLLGSVPFAQVIAKAKGVDLRAEGSGNVGAGNVTAIVGKGWGTLAALLDFLKGLVPVLLAKRAGLGPGAAGLVGVASVVGHNWSIWMKGRSGRGLATSAGVLMALSPALVVWVAGWAIVGWKIGGGLGGFFGWALLPVVAVVLRRPPTAVLLLLFLSMILIGRRMQGNKDDVWDAKSALRRAVFDTDPDGHELVDHADGPLAP